MHQFNHVKLDSLNFDLVSHTMPNGPRTYALPTGEKFPSVTTVLSSFNKKALMEWRQRVGEKEATRISTKAARRGTSLHTACELFILNEMSEVKFQTLMPTTKQLFLQLRDDLVTNMGNVYCVEQALFSRSLRLAGKVDCIAEWKGKLSVIDFKTSTREKNKDKIQNYFMQCTAYAEMFGEITGMPVENIVVAIAVEDEMKCQIFEETKHNYIDDLKMYINRYESQR